MRAIRLVAKKDDRNAGSNVKTMQMLVGSPSRAAELVGCELGAYRMVALVQASRASNKLEASKSQPWRLEEVSFNRYARQLARNIKRLPFDISSYHSAMSSQAG